MRTAGASRRTIRFRRKKYNRFHFEICRFRCFSINFMLDSLACPKHFLLQLHEFGHSSDFFLTCSSTEINWHLFPNNSKWIHQKQPKHKKLWQNAHYWQSMALILFDQKIESAIQWIACCSHFYFFIIRFIHHLHCSTSPHTHITLSTEWFYVQKGSTLWQGCFRAHTVHLHLILLAKAIRANDFQL